ncbi:hypothetical protein [Tardiphaga sp.]|uniref:hypothetical protein n=1 Tax=Tardiphaga sp. TaxID=1926292 RepID=UPI00344D08E0
MTKNQAAIRNLFKVERDSAGNLPSMPGNFPDYAAPIVRKTADGRELALARWGMPSSQLGQATRKRPAKAGGEGQANRLRGLTPEGAGHRCIVPFTSFSEFNKEAGGDIWFALDETRPLA